MGSKLSARRPCTFACARVRLRACACACACVHACACVCVCMRAGVLERESQLKYVQGLRQMCPS
jgi:hypothetical protein